jgi:hypothetical protein
VRLETHLHVNCRYYSPTLTKIGIGLRRQIVIKPSNIKCHEIHLAILSSFVRTDIRLEVNTRIFSTLRYERAEKHDTKENSRIWSENL